jgi:copper chaperone CopZ
MRKYGAILLLAAFSIFVSVNAFACDHESKAEAKVTTASAKSGDDSKVIKANSTSSKGACVGSKASCAAACASKTTTASANTKSGASCNYDKAACGSKVTTASGEKLSNGHPRITVADAQKCSGAVTSYLAVDKMTCMGCVTHVAKTLESLDGVCAVDVNLEKHAATVVYHADKVKTDKLIAAVTEVGYPTTLSEAQASK